MRSLKLKLLFFVILAYLSIHTALAYGNMSIGMTPFPNQYVVVERVGNNYSVVKLLVNQGIKLLLYRAQVKVLAAAQGFDGKYYIATSGGIYACSDNAQKITDLTTNYIYVDSNSIFFANGTSIYEYTYSGEFKKVYTAKYVDDVLFFRINGKKVDYLGIKSPSSSTSTWEDTIYGKHLFMLYNLVLYYNNTTYNLGNVWIVYIRGFLNNYGFFYTDKNNIVVFEGTPYITSYLRTWHSLEYNTTTHTSEQLMINGLYIKGFDAAASYGSSTIAYIDSSDNVKAYNANYTLQGGLNTTEEYAKIEGFIRAQNGKPVDARVVARQDATSIVANSNNGFYKLPYGVKVGDPVRITATAEGFKSTDIVFTPRKAGTYMLNLTLINTNVTGLYGIVTDYLTCNPVAHAKVSVYLNNTNLTTYTNSVGYYHVNVTNRTVKVVVSKVGFLSNSTNVTVRNSTRIDIKLRKLYSLTVSAYLNGIPLTNWELFVTDAEIGKTRSYNISSIASIRLPEGVYNLQAVKSSTVGSVTLIILDKNKDVKIECKQIKMQDNQQIAYAPVHATTLHFFINGAPASNTPITISYKSKENILNTDNTGKLTYYVNSTIPVTISFSGVKRTLYLPCNNYYIYLWNVNLTILDESTGLKFNESVPVTIFYNMKKLASYTVQGCKSINFTTIGTHPILPEIYFRTPLRQVAVHMPTKTVVIYYPKNAIKVKLNIIDNTGHFYGGDIIIRRGNKVIDVEKLEQNQILYLLRGVSYDVYVSTKDGKEMRDIGFFTASNKTVTLTIGGLNLPSFKNEFTYSIYRKNNSIIVEYTNARSVSIEVTSGKSVVYHTTSNAKSGAFVIPINNTSEIVTLTANTSSGNITVSKYFGKKQSILFPIFGKKSWIYNLVAIGIVIVTLLLFGEYRTDVGCVLAVAMAGMLWYWGWLQVSPLVIGVCAIVAGAAVVTVTRRLGI